MVVKTRGGFRWILTSLDNLKHITYFLRGYEVRVRKGFVGFYANIVSKVVSFRSRWMTNQNIVHIKVKDNQNSLREENKVLKKLAIVKKIKS